LLLGQEFGRWKLEIAPLRKKNLERCWEKKLKDGNQAQIERKS